MKFRTGIAIHQWPREPIYRETLIAPKGYLLVEHDFSGQEMRWMAEYSRDPTMLHIFNSQKPYDDAHGYMGAQLVNKSFISIIEALHQDKTSEIYKTAKNDRYLGKFANLSLQYRTSPKTLRSRARIDYGIPMTLMQAEHTSATYLRTFAGVPKYWDKQINFAKANGFVETFSGKRYRFPADAWVRKNYWRNSSTAINWPIQAVGGSQKSLAMKYLKPYWEKTGGEFAWDLHDGIFSFFPEAIALECALEMREMLSNLPYAKEWGFEPSIPFPVDASIGPSWGELEEVI